MDSRVVLVTGSSSGIGESVALLFAKNGYRVVVHGSTSQDKVDKVVAECDKLSPNNQKAFGVLADFKNPQKADLVVTKTIEHFGRLDVLVNNAGTFNKFTSQDGDSLYKAYESLREVNLDSTIKVTYSAVEHLRKSNSDPNIVFVSSLGSKKPARYGTAYCVSKAGMTMFAKCLAVELSPTIRSNIVSPGPVFTPILNNIGLYNEAAKVAIGNQVLLNRIGQPNDIAEAVLFLASEKASWVTGTDFLIDGGYVCSDTASMAAAAAIVKAK